tara:strand:- start:2891 stop:3385 length:495 start_codon:yes stop_codon:yes gene_type:complete
MSVISVKDGAVSLSAQDEIGAITGGNTNTIATVTVANISDTQILSPADNDFLAYDASSSKWTNQNLAEITGLATVASSGDYADLLNKPTLFDGAYSSLSGLPTLFDGAYSSLSGAPTLNRTVGHASGSLPTGTTGDLIHITDDSNKPAYYNGSVWKYISDNTDV